MQKLWPAQSSFRIFIQKPFDEILKVSIDTFRIQNRVFTNVFNQSD